MNSKIPLIDFGIARRAGIQVAGVAEPPLRQRAVLGSRRTRQPTSEWTCTVGLSRRGTKTCKLEREIVFAKEHLRRFREPRAGILEVRGDVHAVKHSGTAAQELRDMKSDYVFSPRLEPPSGESLLDALDRPTLIRLWKEDDQSCRGRSCTDIEFFGRRLNTRARMIARGENRNQRKEANCR